MPLPVDIVPLPVDIVPLPVDIVPLPVDIVPLPVEPLPVPFPAPVLLLLPEPSGPDTPHAAVNKTEPITAEIRAMVPPCDEVSS
jgi:hypothetical protein